MKTPSRQLRLTGWFGRCATALIAVMFCASAVAGPDGSKNVVTAPTKAQPLRSAPKKQYYMFTSASAIPQPIDRVNAPIPTTAIPITVMGNHLGN
jgi:hypothetical protein